ncbi:MAG: hypothetical protein NT062_33595, partial [Proteobacteria bacterium]|nr:hypothetical protein [Pseudomonadota bacterium]
MALADVHGRVVDDVTGAPLVGATVYGSDPDTAVLTDDDGRFVLAGDVLGVTVVADDHAPVVAEVVGGDLRIAMTATRDGQGGEVIEISGGRVTASPGATTLERRELTRVPGARGDALAGLKNLPGVANNGSLTPTSAGLII